MNSLSRNLFKPLWLALAVLAGATLATAAWAQEATIRKNISERMPKFPKIDEITKSPMNGLYELRVNGADIFYSDAEGNFLIQGNLYDTRQSRNLTEERVEKLTAIDFDALPLKDAFTIVRGNGKRKLAVFEDPNCGYCKRFERDLQQVNNVTIHMFLYPDPEPGLGREVQGHLVRQGQGQGMDGLDGARPATRARRLRRGRRGPQRRVRQEVPHHRHAHADFCRRFACARGDQRPAGGEVPGRGQIGRRWPRNRLFKSNRAHVHVNA